MSDRVRITDVAPRDGLQNEPGVIPATDKARLVELLCRTGVDEVEVTSFVSPKWVPQLGDAAEVLSTLARLPLPEGGGWGKGWLGRSFACPRPVTGTAVGAHDGKPTPARDPVAMDRAHDVRRAMSGPEAQLWSHLSGKQLGGYKFRRQHPFGPYILDFYCPSMRVAVEVDGRSHRGEAAQESDARRQAFITGCGVEVLRFSDDEVVHDSDGVARQILSRLRARRLTEPFPLPPPAGRGGPRPVFSALVPNERGAEAARGALEGGALLDKLAVFTAASETFCRRNINASVAESIERFRPVIGLARQRGLAVRGYVSCAIECPFEGPVLPAAVASVAASLAALGVHEIDLGDTIGAGTPANVSAMLRAVWARLGPDWNHGYSLTLHLHDTRGRAADCVRAALDLGVRSFDGSVAGLGGCPYASTPGGRAPGNISTETLVHTVHDAGFETGVDPDRLADAAAFAREIVGVARTAASEGAP